VVVLVAAQVVGPVEAGTPLAGVSLAPANDHPQSLS